MRYPADLLDEIRSRVPVSRVVERHVKLKRAGREYMGLSPFKTEKTPSFTVNDHKGFYHCFASGEHGDIFSFLMKVAGLTFPEAVERLASEAGVILPAPKPVDEAKVGHETRVREALEEACRFFESALAGREGNGARAYLERRGVQFPEIKSFRLGYAPDSKAALKQHLGGKGFSLAEMQDAGLLIHGEDIAIPYDRFRGRLIFPIMDAKGRVIAFGGRALQPEQQPKYLNSPETELFHKGHVLFNLAPAREAAKTAKTVVVAEGYMDVIALTRAGFANAVAPLGTALTSDQLRLLWTMVPLPTLCFDGDVAGQKAAHRALDTALPHLEPGRSLQFAFLPEGRDPDDMVTGGARDALANRLAGSGAVHRRSMGARTRPPSPRHARTARRAGTQAGGVGRADRAQKPKPRICRCIPQAAAHVRANGKQCARARGTYVAGTDGSGSTKGNQAAARRSSRPNDEPSFEQDCAAVRAEQHPPGGALLSVAIARHPWLLDAHVEEIANLHLDDAGCCRIRNAMLTIHQTEELLDSEKLFEHLSREGYRAELERLERACAHNADSHFATGATKEQVLEGWRHVMMLHGKAGVPRSLREAESDWLSDQTSENESKLYAIKQQVEIAAS